MMRRSRYNLSSEEQEAKVKRRNTLIEKKEKVYVEDFNGYCDNTDHPLFSIKVNKDKKFAACYYCSKLWIYREK